MKGTQMIALNKKCWDTVAPYFFQVDCLPKYGPYTASEDEIHLFDSIKGKRFLILDVEVGIRCNIWRNMAQKNCGDLIFRAHKLKRHIKRYSRGIQS